MYCGTDRMLLNTGFSGTHERLVKLCSREGRGLLVPPEPKPNMLNVNMPTDPQPQHTHTRIMSSLILESETSKFIDLCIS